MREDHNMDRAHQARASQHSTLRGITDDDRNPDAPSLADGGIPRIPLDSHDAVSGSSERSG